MVLNACVTLKLPALFNLEFFKNGLQNEPTVAHATQYIGISY
jgi:hypothetical protein